MSVYEKVKAELARKNLELEQQLEKRRRQFDVVFGKIVPRLESYFQKESDALLRDGGRATVTSRLESPLRAFITFVFALPYEHIDNLSGPAPTHSYRLTVTMERICNAEGKLNQAQPKPVDAKPAVLETLGGVDEPDFLIKLDKSLARFIELAIDSDAAPAKKTQDAEAGGVQSGAKGSTPAPVSPAATAVKPAQGLPAQQANIKK